MEDRHNIFISYRQSDGTQLAVWIYQKLLGRAVFFNDRAVTLCPQIDRAIPGGYDWKDYLDNELRCAATLLVVCSPASLAKYPYRRDFYYHEIEWWIKNRSTCRPILIATEADGYTSVPQIIHDAWPDMQLAKVDDTSLGVDQKLSCNAEIFIDSIIRGIENALSKTNPFKIYPAGLLPDHNFGFSAAWQKDRYGKYTFVNELYAQAAGVDSPHAMTGKTDFEMPWRILAPKFLEGDRKIMYEDQLLRAGGVFEQEIMVDRIADIYVTEGVVKDAGRVIGVSGCFLDVTSGLSGLIQNRITEDLSGLCLGPDFGNLFLEPLEAKVLRGILRLYPHEKMAAAFNCSLADVKAVVGALQVKFQCTTENAILITAMRSGLPLRLYE